MFGFTSRLASEWFPFIVQQSSLNPFSPSLTVGELIAAGVRCDKGDEAIGRETHQPLMESLNSVMTRVAAETALSFVLRQTDD